MASGRLGVLGCVLFVPAIGVAQALPTQPGDRAAATLFRLLVEQRYDELDVECDSLRARGRATGNFRTELELASGYLVSFLGIGRHLDAWCVAAPRSANAFTMRGRRRFERAWQLRGLTPRVSPEVAAEFAARMVRADADFEWASYLDLRVPDASAARIEVGLALGVDRQSLFTDFENAVRVDERFMASYAGMLEPLTPKWGGVEGEALEFARSVVASMPEEPALHLLMLRAHLEIAGSFHRPGDYLARRDVRLEWSDAFDRVVAAYPNAAEPWALAAERAAWLEDGESVSRSRLRAARLGDAEQARRHARDLFDGRWQTGDPREAFEWALHAARFGSRDAYADVAEALASGHGVAADPAAATVWWDAIGASPGASPGR